MCFAWESHHCNISTILPPKSFAKVNGVVDSWSPYLSHWFEPCLNSGLRWASSWNWMVLPQSDKKCEILARDLQAERGSHPKEVITWMLQGGCRLVTRSLNFSYCKHDSLEVGIYRTTMEPGLCFMGQCQSMKHPNPGSILVKTCTMLDWDYWCSMSNGGCAVNDATNILCRFYASLHITTAKRL